MNGPKPICRWFYPDMHTHLLAGWIIFPEDLWISETDFFWFWYSFVPQIRKIFVFFLHKYVHDGRKKTEVLCCVQLYLKRLEGEPNAEALGHHNPPHTHFVGLVVVGIIGGLDLAAVPLHLPAADGCSGGKKPDSTL